MLEMPLTWTLPEGATVRISLPTPADKRGFPTPEASCPRRLVLNKVPHRVLKGRSSCNMCAPVNPDTSRQPRAPAACVQTSATQQVHLWCLTPVDVKSSSSNTVSCKLGSQYRMVTTSRNRSLGQLQYQTSVPCSTCSLAHKVETRNSHGLTPRRT